MVLLKLNCLFLILINCKIIVIVCSSDEMENQGQAEWELVGYLKDVVKCNSPVNHVVVSFIAQIMVFELKLGESSEQKLWKKSIIFLTPYPLA